MAVVQCIVTYEEKEFKIRTRNTTVAHLQVLLRKYLKLSSHQAVFIFFKTGLLGRETLQVGSKLLSDIGGSPLHVNVCLENTFGALNKGFVSAKIDKKKELFITSITYSWYHISHWTEIEVFESLEVA